MNKSESIQELAKALNLAQSVMGGAKKGAVNPFFNSKYADLSSVIQAIKEPFADNGNKIGNFAIDFATSLWYHIVLEVTKNA